MPDPLDMPLEMSDAAAMAKELRILLRRALPRPSSPLPLTLQAQSLPGLSDKARIQLAAMGLRLGDRVVIAGQKVRGRSLLKGTNNDLYLHLSFDCKDVCIQWLKSCHYRMH